MKKLYDILELQKMNFFQHIEIAERLKVDNCEHLTRQELIYAILDKQQEGLKAKVS